LDYTDHREEEREAGMRALSVNQWPAILAFAASYCVMGASTPAHAQSFDIRDTFNFIQNLGNNDSGFRPGISDNVGISVSPPFNTQPPLSAQGTSVTACSSPTCQGGLQVSVPYFQSPANPYEFVTALQPYSYTGAWTFSLTNPTINGGLPVIASTINPLAELPLPTQPLVTTNPTPQFVQNVILTPGGPGGTIPTLSWTVPNGYVPSVQSLYIYDKSQPTSGGFAPLVYINNNIRLAPGAQQSWTAPCGIFGSAGVGCSTPNPPQLSPKDNYIISIQLDQTNPALPTPTDIEDRSRTFVNFNVSSVTAPVYVPTIAANGDSQFDISVATGQKYAIDPVVATGFKYSIGAGNPNFATVELPDLQGPEPYTLTWDNGQHTIQVLGGVLFSFLTTDPLGVSAFTVTDIEPAAGVDPTSGVDFVTDLTFVGDGTFTGTMTPITASIPEPSTWTLILLGFAGVGCASCRARRLPVSRTGFVYPRDGRARLLLDDSGPGLPVNGG
jgi:hypothetical protein